MPIISVMNNIAGFYSMFFFTMNHYIYCKKNHVSFQLDTKSWLFKYKNGWTDYFEPIDFTETEQNETTVIYSHNAEIEKFPIWEYRKFLLNEIYIYNDQVKTKIEETIARLGLIKGEYDSIFIRRGDKLFSESSFYPTEKYMELVIQKNPQCKIIFIQTDDYNCVLDAEKYIQENNLSIQIMTLCNPMTKGMVILKKILDTENVEGRNENHKEYLNSIKTGLAEMKSVDNMNPDEIYQHTLEMLVGIDIVLHSNICILDGQSNVSRFICITHDHLENVFDFRFPNDHFDMNRTTCPAWQ